MHSLGIGRVWQRRVREGVCACTAYVVYSFRCIAIGLEQQAHHVQRRALLGGVVQRQLPVLYIWKGARGKASARTTSNGDDEGGSRGHEAEMLWQRERWCWQSGAHTLSTAAAVVAFSAPRSSFITSNVAPSSTAKCSGSIPTCATQWPGHSLGRST